MSIKNAEYHQKNFSDPLMILRMVRVAGLEPTASWSRTTRATNCAIPGYSIFGAAVLRSNTATIIIRIFLPYVKAFLSRRRQIPRSPEGLRGFFVFSTGLSAVSASPPGRRSGGRTPPGPAALPGWSPADRRRRWRRGYRPFRTPAGRTPDCSPASSAAAGRPPG